MGPSDHHTHLWSKPAPVPEASWSLWPSWLCLLSKEHIDPLFDPLSGVRLVGLSIFSEHQAAEVHQTVDKLKQLTDAIRDGLAEGVHSLQVFFKHLTDAFHAFIHGFILGICSAFRPLTRLHQQHDGSHRKPHLSVVVPVSCGHEFSGNAPNSQSRESCSNSSAHALHPFMQAVAASEGWLFNASHCKWLIHTNATDDATMCLVFLRDICLRKYIGSMNMFLFK